MAKSIPEARITAANSVLLVLPGGHDAALAADFCGEVLSAAQLCAGASSSLANKTVYVCGDLETLGELGSELSAAARVFVVRQLAQHHEAGPWPVVDLGRVPLLVHGAGVLVRRLFEPELDTFNRIRRAHAFQSLTESTKPGTAHRTGIYLTPVEARGDALHFRLLRCSSNFSGPTENFGACDRDIVDALNAEAAVLFENAAPLNHVLAQIYCNTPATATRKQTKAKIKGHADKTKDMPANGVLAFCTFYDGLDPFPALASDPFDRGHKRASALTRLHFRLKPEVARRPGCTLEPQFSVTLYPNSVLFTPLSTNRLYTHEIRPSQLDAAQLPTRLGYVVRCSARPAVYAHGRTHIEIDGKLVELEPPTREGMDALRQLYAEENRSDASIDYGDGFVFSMNTGDYAKPELDPDPGPHE